MKANNVSKVTLMAKDCSELEPSSPKPTLILPPQSQGGGIHRAEAFLCQTPQHLPSSSEALSPRMMAEWGPTPWFFSGRPQCRAYGP